MHNHKIIKLATIDLLQMISQLSTPPKLANRKLSKPAKNIKVSLTEPKLQQTNSRTRISVIPSAIWVYSIFPHFQVPNVTLHLALLSTIQWMTPLTTKSFKPKFLKYFWPAFERLLQFQKIQNHPKKKVGIQEKKAEESRVREEPRARRRAQRSPSSVHVQTPWR